VRLDTHGGRFAEGLDYEKSVDVVGHWLKVSGEYNIVEQVLGGRAFQLDPSNILVDKVRRILFGKGVSVACAIHVRLALDNAGYTDAQIVGSSGFNPEKCQIMGAAQGTARHGGHRLIPAGHLDGDLCDGGYCLLRRRTAREGRARVLV
jgi:nicotinate phosphoribosyltransferase